MMSPDPGKYISDGSIRWMDISSYLGAANQCGGTSLNQIDFNGEPFTILNPTRQRRNRS